MSMIERVNRYAKLGNERTELNPDYIYDIPIKTWEEIYTKIQDTKVPTPESGPQPSPYHQAKHDNGKMPWHLLPWGTLGAVVKVFQFGANRYGHNTWQTVPNANERYFSALMRHLVAWREGEAVDGDSGLPHLAHATWNALALLHLNLAKP
jgi:hypothetical protein